MPLLFMLTVIALPSPHILSLGTGGPQNIAFIGSLLLSSLEEYGAASLKITYEEVVGKFG